MFALFSGKETTLCFRSKNCTAPTAGVWRFLNWRAAFAVNHGQVVQVVGWVFFQAHLFEARSRLHSKIILVIGLPRVSHIEVVLGARSIARLGWGRLLNQMAALISHCWFDADLLWEVIFDLLLLLQIIKSSVCIHVNTLTSRPGRMHRWSPSNAISRSLTEGIANSFWSLLLPFREG